MGKQCNTCKEYDQDAVIFREGKGSPFQFIDKSGNVVFELNNVKFDKAAEHFTRIRRGNHAGRTFIIEQVTPSDGWMASWLKKVK